MPLSTYRGKTSSLKTVALLHKASILIKTSQNRIQNEMCFYFRNIISSDRFPVRMEVSSNFFIHYKKLVSWFVIESSIYENIFLSIIYLRSFHSISVKNHIMRVSCKRSLGFMTGLNEMFILFF